MVSSPVRSCMAAASASDAGTPAPSPPSPASSTPAAAAFSFPSEANRLKSSMPAPPPMARRTMLSVRGAARGGEGSAGARGDNEGMAVVAAPVPAPAPAPAPPAPDAWRVRSLRVVRRRRCVAECGWMGGHTSRDSKMLDQSACSTLHTHTTAHAPHSPPGWIGPDDRPGSVYVSTSKGSYEYKPCVSANLLFVSGRRRDVPVRWSQ